jgi:hypothetical protein
MLPRNRVVVAELSVAQLSFLAHLKDQFIDFNKV